MTLLSRRMHPGAGSPAQNRPVPWASRWWHVACIPLLASGCLYLGPIPTLEENVAPVVLRKTETPTGVILIGPEGHKVTVLARDPEDDPMVFIWRLSRDGVLGTAYPVNNGLGSEIDLPFDQELDGQTLYVDIDDGQNDYVTVFWPLEVLL
ncbi:MAG: hypothetical protein Q8P18_28635 [Pseudomonadota bacterium]|nr:hypothetical protein [Pseudomonadota bacterium]